VRLAALDKSLQRLLIRTIAKLSKKSGQVPSCLMLRGVREIGEHLVDGGSFGDVWKGVVEGHVIAIKAMRFFGSHVDDAHKVFSPTCHHPNFNKSFSLQAFANEAVIWRSFSHPNVLPFYGVYRWKDRLSLVSPWMENGNVIEYLKKVPDADRVALVRWCGFCLLRS
jgi:serine/threonine protein kinase